MREEVDEFLEKIDKRGQLPGLERISLLLDRLDRPERAYRIIHIAGTNGKGSTAEYIYNILREENISTGIYTSPSINFINSRIEVDGKEISEEDFYECSKYLMEIVEEKDIEISKFEFITALSFYYFKKKKISYLILETGMGGKNDATNAIENSLISIITNIGMDHMNFLGDTIEEIAREKAGIIKNNSNVIFYGNKEIDYIFEEVSKEKDSKLTYIDKKSLGLKEISLGYMNFLYKAYDNIESQMIGFDQVNNIAMAIEAVEILRRDINISDRSIYDGIRNTKLPYVFEILNREPLIIVDGAHNPQSVQSMIDKIVLTLDRKKVKFVFGVLKDKEYKKLIDLTYLRAEKYYLISPDNKSRALDAFELKKEVDKKNIESEAFLSIEDGIAKAIRESDQTDVIIVFGSFYNGPRARKYIKEWIDGKFS